MMKRSGYQVSRDAQGSAGKAKADAKPVTARQTAASSDGIPFAAIVADRRGRAVQTSAPPSRPTEGFPYSTFPGR